MRPNTKAGHIFILDMVKSHSVPKTSGYGSHFGSMTVSPLVENSRVFPLKNPFLLANADRLIFGEKKTLWISFVFLSKMFLFLLCVCPSVLLFFCLYDSLFLSLFLFLCHSLFLSFSSKPEFPFRSGFGCTALKSLFTEGKLRKIKNLHRGPKLYPKMPSDHQLSKFWAKKSAQLFPIFLVNRRILSVEGVILEHF